MSVAANFRVRRRARQHRCLVDLTLQTAADSFVLTLELDSLSFERLNALRRLHFPRERNFLAAHLTLLHTVSAEQLRRLQPALFSIPHHPLALRFTGLRFLGGGVAYAIESPALTHFRRQLMEELGGPFTRQDSQSFRPHVTVQNKVDAAVAKHTFALLSASFEGWEGEGMGLLIWRYCGGPWERVARLPFARPVN